MAPRASSSMREPRAPARELRGRMVRFGLQRARSGRTSRCRPPDRPSRPCARRWLNDCDSFAIESARAAIRTRCTSRVRAVMSLWLTPESPAAAIHFSASSALPAVMALRACATIRSLSCRCATPHVVLVRRDRAGGLDEEARVVLRRLHQRTGAQAIVRPPQEVVDAVVDVPLGDVVARLGDDVGAAAAERSAVEHGDGLVHVAAGRRHARLREQRAARAPCRSAR